MEAIESLILYYNKLFDEDLNEEQVNEFNKLMIQNQDQILSIYNVLSMEKLMKLEKLEEERENYLDKLREFLDGLIDKEIITENEIIECFEENLLFKLEYINKSDFIKKRIQLYTKKNYK